MAAIITTDELKLPICGNLLKDAALFAKGLAHFYGGISQVWVCLQRIVRVPIME